MTNPKSITFWAEIASNHNRDLGRCLDFIDCAARIGCQATKFQLFKIDQLLAPEVAPFYKNRKAWELPQGFIKHLAQKCHDKQIEFICTPFDLDAVEVLEPYVDRLKIASYELLWSALLESCAKTGKPITLSTGMASLDEVKKAVDTLRKAGCQDLTLLHCASCYPLPIEDCNLSAIETLRKNFQCPVGWSDHSISPAVIYRVIHHWQASLVEFHLDLDGQGAEFEIGHCWLPVRIKEVIKNVREGVQADGAGVKIATPSEILEHSWRADPSDGLRPRISTRKKIQSGKLRHQRIK